jgi:hypothetical protein
VLKGAGLDLHDFWTLRWAAQKDDIMAAVAAMMAEKDADRLVAMALKDAAFFTNDAVFADIAVHGQRRTCGIDSSEFRDWLQHEHYKKTKTTVSDGAVRQAIRALTARAKYEDGIPHHTVYIRFAEHGGRSTSTSAIRSGRLSRRGMMPGKSFQAHRTRYASNEHQTCARCRRRHAAASSTTCGRSSTLMTTGPINCGLRSALV